MFISTEFNFVLCVAIDDDSGILKNTSFKIKSVELLPADHQCTYRREDNLTERVSMGVGRDILVSKKLFLVTMRTMRKHFSVSWLTSGRLAFVNQSEVESTNLK